MGRKSTIDLLPAEVRDALTGWLEDPAIDIDEAQARANTLLTELGLEHLAVSRSAVGRKAKSHREQVEKLGQEMRAAKVSREAFYSQFGDDLADQGGKFLAETLQAFIFKLQLALHRVDEFDLTDPEAIHDYSITVKNLTTSIKHIEEALSKYTKREAEIRKAATEQAAEAAGSAAQQQGLSAQAVQAIKHQILGIEDGSGK